MQRIIVKNFGPLKDIDLEIKDYMVFLGPQASGKSTLAKLIYGFKEVIWITSLNSELWESTSNDKKFSLKFSIDDWERELSKFFYPILQVQQKYFIHYSFEPNVSITLTQKNEIINIEFSDLLITKIKKIEKEVEKEIKWLKANNFQYDDDLEILQYTVNVKILQKILHTFHVNGLLLIPDKRDINQNGDTTPFYYNNLRRYRGYFREGFKSVEHYLQNVVKSFNKKDLEIIKLYFNKILKGNYENIDEGKIVLSDGTKVSLNLASSGQREVIGILIILTIEIFNRSHKFYVIEEPEAHLFPEAQKDITYLISLLANQEGNQVIITTHSHYILGALNILINAHRIGQTNPEEVEKIIPRELWVDKNRIFAGFLENGEIKNIYDDEAEMIKIQQLNAVAGEINKDFDKLLDLEFANEEIN